MHRSRIVTLLTGLATLLTSFVVVASPASAREPARFEQPCSLERSPERSTVQSFDEGIRGDEPCPRLSVEPIEPAEPAEPAGQPPSSNPDEAPPVPVTPDLPEPGPTETIPPPTPPDGLVVEPDGVPFPPAVTGPCAGLQVAPLLVLVDPDGNTFDVTLSDICFAVSNPVAGATRYDVTAHLVGPGLDVVVAGQATFDGTGIASFDLRGAGSYDAANIGVQGVIRIHGATGRADIEVSGALRSSGALITGDVTGSLLKTDVDRYVLDLTGAITYRKGTLTVTGSVTTHLDGTTPLPFGLPTDVDPATLIGNLRVKGRASFGSISGGVDVFLSRPTGTDPVFANLTLTGIELVKGIGLARLDLGNTDSLPATFAIDAELTVPKILSKEKNLRGVGTGSLQDGSFDLAIEGGRQSSPWLGLFFVRNTDASVRLVGTPAGVRLSVEVTMGVGIPVLGTGGGGAAALNASLNRQTGAISASLDISAAGCVLFCVLASVDGRVHLGITGNLSQGTLDVVGGGSARGSVLFGAVASGNGSARVDAHLDFSGPRLVMSGTAAYALKASSWFGLSKLADDWMDLRLDGDRITIVDGQWRHKREKVTGLRGEVYPVKRMCGNRYTRHRIDFNGWDYKGKWGDCAPGGGVALGTVSGRLLTDTDGNGSQSPADEPVADQDLVIKNSSGSTVGVGYTDDDGYFSVRATPGSGLRLHLDPMPADRYQGYRWPGAITVPNSTMSVGTIGLGIVKFGSVTGTAFHDRDEDGVHDANEPVQAGMRVVVTRDGATADSRTVTTDDTGRWAMGGLDQRFTYQARYWAPSGYWVWDDPFALDEDLDVFSVRGPTPREVRDIALVNTRTPIPGTVIRGQVYKPACNDPYGYGYGSYGYGSYSGNCDPYGSSSYGPGGPVVEAEVRLDDGHVARTDYSGGFTMEGVSPGTHSYWVMAKDGSGYASGTVQVSGTTTWLTITLEN